MTRRALLALAAIFLAGTAIAAPADSPAAPSEAAPATPALWDAEMQPGLPNVLILGDSISMSYTGPVRRQLQGKANVVRPMRPDGRGPENCGDTRIGLANIDRWLGDVKWDVIHFNWGLWDLCYRNPESPVQGNRDKVKGEISVPPEEYARNLEALVAKLQATGAKLVWASTTFVPDGEIGRFTGDDVRYNAVAARVMQARNIPINDLHKLSAGLPPERFVRPGDVHFTRAGAAALGAQVAEHILALLPAPDGTGR